MRNWNADVFSALALTIIIGVGAAMMFIATHWR